MMIKTLTRLRKHMEMNPLVIIVIRYHLLCVFYSNTLKIMLVDYVVTEMGCFDNYLDAAPHAKSMRGNGITTLILHVSQCITFHQTIFVTATLISEA